MTNSFLKTVIIFLIQLYHLPLYADDTIKVSSNLRKPEISIQIAGSMAATLRSQHTINGGSVLRLHLVSHDTVNNLPVYGSYRLIGKCLTFTPLYDLGESLTYEIQYIIGRHLLSKRFTVPGQEKKTGSCEISFFPSTDTIPQNILFFHARFSTPMHWDNKGFVHFNILDEKGVVIENVWRQKSYWLDSGRLLLLMIHPGRVKSGIHYIGPVFEVGKSYTIKIDDSMQDADNNAVQIVGSKQYFISPEDRISPKIKYVTNAVSRNTKDPIEIHFTESMDYASTISNIKIYGAGNNYLASEVVLKNADSVVCISPGRKWKHGTYKIVLQPAVSDIAANRINRLFEITDIKEKKKDTIYVIKHFEVK